jgi:small subunit ribosomal protein S8
MRHDTLADALSIIKNAERIGKKECIVPASKIIKEVLRVFKEHDYIGATEFIDDGRAGKFKIELKGKIIDCNVIKPHFSVKVEEFQKWEKRFLPSPELGLIVLTTSKGIIDHKKAKEIHIGGKLLCFVY